MRGSFYRWALVTRGPVLHRQSVATTVAQIGGGVVGFVLMLVSLVAPHLLAWGALALPAWVRWSGLGVGIMGLVLLT